MESPCIYIQFSDDGQHIRKWTRRPFDGAIAFQPVPSDMSDYETFEVDMPFDELLDALRANGSVVQHGLLDTDRDTFTPIAND